MKNMLRNTIAATLLLAGVIQHASADIVTVTGDTTNGPVFSPPTYWGGSPDPANMVAYQAFDVVTEQGPNPFNWENSFLTSCEFACVTFLYSEQGFDPNDSMTNLMTISDNLYHFSAMQTFLEPGKHYTFVVTGYSDLDAGAFSITAASTAGISISPVPEPSAGLMLLGGLAGIGALARRRARGVAQLS